MKSTRRTATRAALLAGAVACMMASCLPSAQAWQAAQAISQLNIPGASPVAVYRPASIKNGAPAPLVFLLHGSSGEGASTLSGSSLKAAADKHGFIIAAPTGAMRLAQGYAWNIPGVVTAGGTAPGAGDRDDVQYVLTIFDRLVQQGIVDRELV